MPDPKELRGIKNWIRTYFRTKDQYEISHPIERRLSHLSDKEFEKILQGVEDKFFSYYPLTHDDELHPSICWDHIRARPLKLLKGGIYAGVDGSSIRIEREELCFIFSRSVSYTVSRTKALPRRYGSLSAKAFFIIDEGILNFEAIDRGLLENTTRGSALLSYIKDSQPIFIGYNRQSLKNANSQSIGYEVKIRQLNELMAADLVTQQLSSIDAGPKTLILDGNLYPTSVEPQLSRKIIEQLDKRGCYIVALAKRISYSRHFLNMMAKSHEIQKILSAYVNPDRFASDGPLLRRILRPLWTTFFFRYDMAGHTGRGGANINRNWKPLATYFMTGRGFVYRLEMPFKYYQDGTYKGLTKRIIALTECNYGCLPRSNDVPDNLSTIKAEERRQLSAWLDNLFLQERGIELMKPYGV